MPDIKFPAVTPSRASDLACSRRFYQEHALKLAPKPDFSPALAYGSGIHEALKHLLDPAIPLLPQERDLPSIVQRAFLRQPYPDPTLREADASRAFSMLRNYLTHLKNGEAILGVEATWKFALPKKLLHPLQFVAKFDALVLRDDDPDCLIVKDFKTGQLRQIDFEAACVTLAVALARLNDLACALGKPFRRVLLEYDYLGEEGLLDRVVVTKAEVASVWPQVRENAVRLYDSDEFPPTPNELCVFCPFRSDCQPARALTDAQVYSLFGAD
jgi:hypothetical protein